MILADKIINERKKNGWSQEQLAEQLDVSRQSVSKWESAQSIPDLNRIIQMASIFGVSTDYLLKDDFQEEGVLQEIPKSYQEIEYRKVSLEEAQDFLKFSQKISSRIGLGVSLCVFAVAPTLWVLSLTQNPGIRLSENMAGALGMVLFFMALSCGIYLLMTSYYRSNKYEYLEKEAIDTEYGVEGLVKKNMDVFEPKYHRSHVIGTLLCLFSCIPVVVASFLTESGGLILALVGLLFTVVSMAVYLFVSRSVIHHSHQKLLQQGDYSTSNKKVLPILSRIASVFWLVTTIIYFAYSFITNDWQHAWIVWPIAALSFVVVIIVSKMLLKVED